MVRIGFVGCGVISGLHVRSLLAVPGAEIVALADVMPENIANLKALYPALADAAEYRNYHEMLPTVDAALVLTPHHLHYAHIKDCLIAGVHVLSEKPFVTHPEQARELIDFARERERILMVSYQNPQLWPYRYTRQQIADGKLGEIVFYSGQITQNWGVRGGWRLNATEGEGGMLVDTGSHFVDLMLYLTGMRPEVVVAMNDTDGQQIDIINGALIRFNGGRVATLAAVGRGPTLWHITIIGTKGTIELTDRDNIMQIGSDNYTGWIGTPRTNLVPPEGERPESTTPDAQFVGAIARHDLSASDAERGLVVAQLTEAIYASAHAGGTPIHIAVRE